MDYQRIKVETAAYDDLVIDRKRCIRATPRREPTLGNRAVLLEK